MSERRLESLVDELHRTSAEAAVPDAELLARYVQLRDPAAFELVVWRHGAMVQAVCRRVLGRSSEVDDLIKRTARNGNGNGKHNAKPNGHEPQAAPA